MFKKTVSISVKNHENSSVVGAILAGNCGVKLDSCEIIEDGDDIIRKIVVSGSQKKIQKFIESYRCMFEVNAI